MLHVPVWVSLDYYEGEDTVETVIGTWYNAQQLATCPFDRVVLVKEYPDAHQYDPYRHSLFVLYSVRPVIGTLYVHGACTWYDAWNRAPMVHNLCVDVPEPLVAVRAAEAVMTHVDGDGTLYELMAYVEWLMGNGQRTFEMQPVLSLSGAIIVSLIEDPEVRKHWHKVLLHKEGGPHLIAHFTANLVRLEPTRLDLQHFYLRDPSLAPPSYVYEVPAEDGPPYLPVHPTGTRHLTHVDLDAWSRAKYATWSKRLFRPMVQHADPRLVDLARRMEKFSIAMPAQPAQTVTGRAAHLELCLVPPCIRQIMEAQRFPPFEQAKTLVRAFVHSGITKESVEAWLEEQNRRWPKQPHAVPLKVRFDLDYWWNADKLHKAWCKKLVDAGMCPFGDIEDYKARCAPHNTNFSGPHTLIKRAVFVQARNAASLAQAQQPPL